ncbi:hypothetical protein [Methylobacterium sp. sgz302541]|uniref:hypothetical protein n=1 Tax=unclassified Methylobacterium TaxID=2615210 RepID=UPI003D33D650
MQAAITTTARVTLPAVGIGTIAAIFTLPTGIASGPVAPWIPLLWLSGGMIAVGAAAWIAR